MDSGKNEQELEFETKEPNHTNAGVDLDGEILVKKAKVDGLNSQIDDLSSDNTKLKNRKMTKQVSSKKSKILIGVFSGLAVGGIAVGTTGTVMMVNKKEPTPINYCEVKFKSDDESVGTISGCLVEKVEVGTKCKDINFPKVNVVDDNLIKFDGWYFEDGKTPITDESTIQSNCQIIAKFKTTAEVIPNLTNIVIKEDSILKYKINKDADIKIEYSFDNINWNKFETGKELELKLPKYKILYLKGDNPNGLNDMNSEQAEITKLTFSEGNVEFDGNIMALLDNGKGEQLTIPNNKCFCSLFQNSTALRSVSKDFLPANDLSVPKNWLSTGWGCYKKMFMECVNLEKVPMLPATQLSKNCYADMFNQCKSLTKLSEYFTLPAKHVPAAAYANMFCKSGIEELPEGFLPAEEVDDAGYCCMFEFSAIKKIPKNFFNFSVAESNVCNSMFYGCEQLVDIPNDLFKKIKKISGSFCFETMFKGCISLEKIPEDLFDGVENVGINCFAKMFGSCWSLKNIAWLPAKKLATGCYAGMYAGCPSLSSKINKNVFVDYVFNYIEEFAEDWAWDMFGDDKYYEKSETTYVGTEPFNLPDWTELKPFCFSGLNANYKSITNIPNDYLSKWTQLDKYCYESMFYGCSNIVDISNLSLPANKLSEGCYCDMFENCSSLKNTPKLLATELAEKCYESMFYRCKNLEEANDLPAIKLTSSCYFSMFRDCISLTKPPKISCTELKNDSCRTMFAGCKNLKISNNGAGEKAFFTCPVYSKSELSVWEMFQGTGGSYTDDPIAGETYYFE